MDWALRPLSRWSDFSGRSRRREYWSFVGLCVALSLVVSMVEAMIGLSIFGFGPLSLVLSIALLVPGLAVTVRRLHDTGRSGWFAAVALVPFVGGIVLLVLCALEGEPSANRWGADPLAGERAVAA